MIGSPLKSRRPLGHVWELECCRGLNSWVRVSVYNFVLVAALPSSKHRGFHSSCLDLKELTPEAGFSTSKTRANSRPQDFMRRLRSSPPPLTSKSLKKGNG